MAYTIEELRQRHSVRKFADRQLPDDVTAALQAEVKDINDKYKTIRFELRMDEPQVFADFKKTYGMFSGVRNYLLAVVDTTDSDAEEIAGFAGEQFVMKAQTLGLGTCFVGATYDAEKIDLNLKDNEKITFLIPFGYKEGEGNTEEYLNRYKDTPRINRSPDTFYAEEMAFFNLSEALSQMPWLEQGLEALACAPSGMNKQPVRVWEGEDTYLHAGLAETNPYTSNDLGIAKYNFQAVVPGRWEWGVDGRFFKE